MENTTKITKTMKFEMIRDIIEASDADKEVVDMLVDFCNTNIDALAEKAVKAKEQAAKKKAESDELCNTIKDILTSEYQTIAEIMTDASLEDVEKLTKAKVTSRLGRLVREGVAEKVTVKDGNNNKVVAYRLLAVEG